MVWKQLDSYFPPIDIITSLQIKALNREGLSNMPQNQETVKARAKETNNTKTVKLSQLAAVWQDLIRVEAARTL